MQVRTARTTRSAQRGLTLIEICVALAVVAVLAGAAVPSMDGSRKKQVLDGTAAELAADLHFARSESLARNQGVRVSVHTVAGGGQCVLLHTGSTAECSCGAAGFAQCTGEATLIKAHAIAANAAVHVSANVPSMRFDPMRGTVTPAGTMTVTLADGRAVSHVVSLMGRVRSCSPGGAVAGYKAC
jgi:type IV fimbrial biogenesis protein FimT